MAITFDEIAKTVVDLVIEVRRLNDENKALYSENEALKNHLSQSYENVREPDETKKR